MDFSGFEFSQNALNTFRSCPEKILVQVYTRAKLEKRRR